MIYHTNHKNIFFYFFSKRPHLNTFVFSYNFNVHRYILETFSPVFRNFFSFFYQLCLLKVDPLKTSLILLLRFFWDFRCLCLTILLGNAKKNFPKPWMVSYKYWLKKSCAPEGLKALSCNLVKSACSLMQMGLSYITRNHKVKPVQNYF